MEWVLQSISARPLYLHVENEATRDLVIEDLDQEVDPVVVAREKSGSHWAGNA